MAPSPSRREETEMSGTYRLANQYDPALVPYGRANLWIGVEAHKQPSDPVERRRAKSFSCVPVIGACDDGIVFACNRKKWLLPRDEERHVEVYWHYDDGMAEWVTLDKANEYAREENERLGDDEHAQTRQRYRNGRILYAQERIRNMREGEMSPAWVMAEIWACNLRNDIKWFRSYGKRTGATHDEIFAERMGYTNTDVSWTPLGIFEGYRLYKAKVIKGDLNWMYIVITPYANEQTLCHLIEPDDAKATAYLKEVLKEIKAIFTPNDQKSVETKKTPSAEATGSRAASDEPVKAATKTEKVEKEPETPSKAERKPVETKTDVTERPRTRSKGRPKGSRDSKPRRRRTKAEMAADRANETQNVGIDLTNGPVPADNDAWIPDNDGKYRRYDVWYGGSWLQIRIDGEFVDLPANAVLSEKNVRPAVLSTFETKNRKRRATTRSRW